MIKLFDKDTIDFTTLGIGVLTDAISCEVAEKINADFEVEMEYPITGQLFNEIRNLRILYLKPNDYTSEQPFRIYSITKPIDGVVTINAQHVSYDLSGYLFCPKQNDLGEYPIYTKAKEFFDALNAGIQNGSVYPNTCPFRFECNMEDETEGIQISEITNIRKILTSAADAFEGEYEFDGFTVRMKSKRGSNRGFSVTYSKNMVELEATVNSQGSATGIFPYFKSEETKTVQGINRTWVKVYIAQNGEYPKANWLTDKAESQQAVTPVINTQAYIVTLRPDDPASYEQYKDHIVIWRTAIVNSYIIAGFTPDENGNYPYNALSTEKDSDISIVPVNKHYYRTVSNSVYTYYKFNSTSNKYEKQDSEGEYEDITDQKPVFCFVNQNPTKDSSGETIMDEHYLVDDFGRELSPATGKDYMTSLNEMIGILNHFYYWTTDDFDNAIQLWVISGKEKNQNGNYESDALTATQGSLIPKVPTDGNWYKIFIEESTYEYYKYSSEEGFYMRQTGTGRYHEYSKDTKFEAAPTIIGTMSETKTLEHYVDLPEKIIYVNGLENQQYQKITRVDLTEYLNDKLATRVGSTVYEYDKVTINENAVMYSSAWLNVGGEPELDFIAQQITTADKNDENGKNFYGRLFCWNGSNYYEVYGLPRTYLVANPEPADSNGNYNYNQFSTEVNGTPLEPRANFYYKLLQGSTYIYYKYNTDIIRWEFKANASEFYRHVADSDEYISVYVEGKSTYYSDSETYYVKDGSSYVVTTELAENLDEYCTQRGMFEKCKNTDGTPMNPSQFPKDEALCVDGEGKKYVEPRRKRILNSAEPSEQELRDAAVEYLEKNDVNVANNTFTVTFAKLSRSPEYSKWKELEHVELGDSISIIYSDLGVIQHEIEVVGLAYDAINDKYTQVELGNVATSLADTAVTSSDGVSVLKNDKGYTDVKKVADIIAENITANYIKAMTAEFTEAQIQQLEATRLDITEALTASQASIDEIVSNLLIADDAVIKNTLTSGEISVKGDISIESGEINLGIIAKFNNQANNIYYKDGDVYKHVYDGTNGIYFNPNTIYYVDDGEHPMFTDEKASDIGVKYGDGYQSVVGTFWEENRIYYKNIGTEENPNWQQETITSDNVNDYTELETRYVSIDVEDNLENYTDTYNGYRFNVENTGAMHIQNNNGVELLEFDDETGSLILYGDVQSHRVIADDTLIVGSDNIESASMYYNPTDGLKIVDGEINLNDLFRVDRDGNLYVGGTTTEDSNMYYNPTDGLVFRDGNINMGGKFTVNDEGEVDITQGEINLGEIKNDYKATPVVSSSFSVEDGIGKIAVHAEYQNGATLPESETLNFTYTINGYDLPMPDRFSIDLSGTIEETDGYWYAGGSVTLLYNGTPWINKSGRELGVWVTVVWEVLETYSGEHREYEEYIDVRIPDGQTMVEFYQSTGVSSSSWDFVPGSDNWSYSKMFEPNYKTITGSSSITILENNNSSDLIINTIAYDVTYTLTAPKSGEEINLPEHVDGYKFVVNNDGELKAASGSLIAQNDQVKLFDGRFVAMNNEVSLNGNDTDSSSLIADKDGIRIINGPLVCEKGIMSDGEIRTSDSVVSNGVQTNEISITEQLKIGNTTVSTVTDSSADVIEINTVLTQKELIGAYNNITEDKSLLRVRLYLIAKCNPTNSQYLVTNFDYTYTIMFKIVLKVTFRLIRGPKIESSSWYSSTASAVGVVYRKRSNSSYVAVQNNERLDFNFYTYYIKIDVESYRTASLDDLLDGGYCVENARYYTYYKFTSDSINKIYKYNDSHQLVPVYDGTTDVYADEQEDYYIKEQVEGGGYRYVTITLDELVSDEYCKEDNEYFYYQINFGNTVDIKANESGTVYINPTGKPNGFYTADLNLDDALMPDTREYVRTSVEDSTTVYIPPIENPKYPKVPNTNNVTLAMSNAKIVPSDNSRIFIGTEEDNIYYGAFTNLLSQNNYIIIGNTKYRLSPIYVHHITITGTYAGTEYTAYITVEMGSDVVCEDGYVIHANTPIVTFAKVFELLDYYANHTDSIYYTGRTHPDNSMILQNLPCIVNNGTAVRFCTAAYIEVEPDSDVWWEGIGIYMTGAYVYFSDWVDPPLSSNYHIAYVNQSSGWSDSVTMHGTTLVEVED